jgi:hypothetical protein
VYILVFDGLFVLRVVLIKFKPLGPSELSLVKSDLLLDWLDMKGILGKIHLRFYLGV